MEPRRLLAPFSAVVVTSLLTAALGGSEALATDLSQGPLDPVEQKLSPADAIPVPADYDGDGSTDIALKGSNGVWYIDFGANGLGAPPPPWTCGPADPAGLWDRACTGYGGATAVPVPARYDSDAAADLAAKDGAGMWGLDYAATGFGLWDWQLFGYGNSLSVPVPADYDGDGMADLAVKSSTGDWYINYSADGLANGWDALFTGYGNAAAIPVPADYDGDGRADLSVKDSGGCWYIDYASDGFGGWNEIRCGYGDATAVPVPADYDNDGRADLSVKGNDGNWYVDYAAGGFGAWNAIYGGRGNNSSIAVPGDYDNDGLLDLSVYSTVDAYWLIDYASNGFAFWDSEVANWKRIVVDTTRPYITSTTIYGEGNVAVSQMTVGVRYVVDVVVHRGSGPDNAFGVEINDALHVPESLQIVNRYSSTYVGNLVDLETHRRYAITPTAPGNFPLGFQLRTAPPYYAASTEVFNPDYGFRVLVVSPPQTAISGRVTQRAQNAQGVFVDGPPIEGATVKLVSSGGLTTTTDSDGRWHFPVAGGSVPMAVRITKPGFSEMNVVNLHVPISGLFVNTPLEQAFSLLPGGITYKTYLDYSRGRTLLHVVEIASAAGAVSVGKSTFDPVGGCPAKGQCDVDCTLTECGTFDTLHDVGQSLNALVIMNGTWWNVCSANPVGYVYSNGFLGSEVWCDNRCASNTDCSGSNVYYAEGGGTAGLYPAGTTPMLTISPFNGFEIVESNANFLEVPSTQWSQVGNPPYPIWDVAPRDGVSDVAYAIQIPNPPLLRNGQVIAAGHFAHDAYCNYDYAFARTTVGVGPTGQLFLVAADGEGVHGGNGATSNQMGHFYRDVLGATTAMGLDSGLSTELLIRTAGGLYRVNTITGEDAQIQENPYTQVLPTSTGGIGSVGYYIAVNGDVTEVRTAANALAFALHVRSRIGASRVQFELTLPQAAAAELKLYDVRGRRVATVFQGDLGAGVHSIPWQGKDDHGATLAAGVYYYRATAGPHQAAGSVVIMR